MIIAKTEPEISLEVHSNQVRDAAIYIAKLNNPKINKAILDKIAKVAYLHDIGKAERGFQSYIKHGIETNGKYFNHQEIGWAFLQKYTDMDDMALNVIYWHHGVSRPKFSIEKRENVDMILKGIDISDMKVFYEREYGKLKTPRNTSKCFPLFYDPEMDDEHLTEIMFIKTCVVSADRFVSELLGDVPMIKNKILDITSRQKFTIDKNPYKNNIRFKLQQQIVKACAINSLIKGPAGFGKTLNALMWLAQSTNIGIWACPRNTIAESVYLSILKELKNTNNEHITVELYLTGETKKTNNPGANFDSDIIVTNIDNFLKPNCDIANADKLYLVNNADIIFDECHELRMGSPIFELSILVNDMRTEYCNNARTLFLTATPSFIVDMLCGGVKHLPSRDSHYSSVHKKYYNLEVKEYSEVKDKIFDSKDKSTLSIFNSIQNAQNMYSDKSMLFHSKYLPDVRIKKFSEIFFLYNKESSRNSFKKNLIGTHIIQASLDISFRNLYECILSPESTLQRIGRCNRWGDFRLQSNLICFTQTDQSNISSIQTLYETRLNKLWVKYLKEIQGKITLDELYVHYNKFNEINEDLIHSYCNDLKIESKRSMGAIFPRKYNNSFRNEEIMDANGNKLRNTGYSIFYILKRVDSNEWVGPFTEEIFDIKHIDKQFKESHNIERYIKAVQLLAAVNKRFEFSNNHHISNKTLDLIRRQAVKSNMPYVRFDIQYDEAKGIIKVK